MATALVNPLPTIHPVYDPLTVALADAGDPASGRLGQSQVEVQLEIEDVLDSNSWRLIGEYLNPYNYDTDEATVTIHTALQGALSAEPTLIRNSMLNELTGVVKRYRLKVRDVIDGEPDGAFVTLDPAYAWQAGKKGTFQYANPLNGNAYRFLTRLPSTRRINPKERITLQFIALETVADVELELTSTLPNGSISTGNWNLGNITQYHCYSTSVAPPSGFATQPVKIVAKLTGAFVGTQRTITYEVTPNPSPWGHQLYLRNSYGGYDSLYCTGKRQKSMALSSDIFEAQEFPIEESKRGNTSSFNQRGREQYVFRTGFVSKDELEGIVDLLLRNEAWHEFNNRLWPIVITSNNILESEDGNYLYAAEFTAEYAFDHLAY